jgi:hypothetical protein
VRKLLRAFFLRSAGRAVMAVGRKNFALAGEIAYDEHA